MDYQDIPFPTHYHPKGETDSELAFCYLADIIFEREIVDWNESDFEWLEGKLRDLNDLGTLNCLMSDGRYLFCYCDEGAYNGGLSYVRRVGPFGNIRLVDKDYLIDLSGKKDPAEAGYVIATSPLTDEEWIPLNPAQLVVFEDGQKVWGTI